MGRKHNSVCCTEHHRQYSTRLSAHSKIYGRVYVFPVRDVVFYLVTRSFTSAYVRIQPINIRRHIKRRHVNLEEVREQVLWDRNPGFLKSEIGPFSDFKRKSYLMDLKSAHSQESDFQESGEVDRFLKMGTHFQERSGSLENGLCIHGQAFSYAQGICG